MGGDYYGGRDVGAANTSSGYSADSAQALSQTTQLHSSLNPARWADEQLQCEYLDPIVFALDVTGSMGDWTKIIYDKMPMFYGQIMMQKYLTDPALSFCAIGDVTCDDAPLQISEFGQGKGIDQLISKMWLEGGGGGNQHESYDLSAYFYSTHVDLLNPEFPFFFVTGDEGFWEKTNSTNIAKLFGKGIKEKEIISKVSWANLMSMFNVFHIKKPFYNEQENKTIDNQWKRALGNERVLHIKTPKACIDVMLGAIALTSGARDLNGYIEDMKVRGQDEDRIKEVTDALKPYSDMLKAGTAKVIRHVPKNIPSKVEEINVSTNPVNADDINELRQLYEKLALEDLDTGFVNQRNILRKLLSEKGDSIQSNFICPLTGEIIIDPVSAADGHSYERKAIERWFEKHDYSPVTGEKLDSKHIMPSFALKALIKDYCDSFKLI